LVNLSTIHSPRGSSPFPGNGRNGKGTLRRKSENANRSPFPTLGGNGNGYGSGLVGLVFFRPDTVPGSRPGETAKTNSGELDKKELRTRRERN
jgi:hypothetical protein